MMNEPIISNVTKSIKPSSLLRQTAARPALYQAWRKVRANRGAAGIDAIGVQAFERDLEANLAELSRNLLDGTYEPLPSRYVEIPKENGKARELAIPTVRDRVAQRAVLDRIEPLFEPQMLDCSFAFRAGRSTEMAVQRIVVAARRVAAGRVTRTSKISSLRSITGYLLKTWPLSSRWKTCSI